MVIAKKLKTLDFQWEIAWILQIVCPNNVSLWYRNKNRGFFDLTCTSSTNTYFELFFTGLNQNVPPLMILKSHIQSPNKCVTVEVVEIIHITNLRKFFFPGSFRMYLTLHLTWQCHWLADLSTFFYKKNEPNSQFWVLQRD